MDTFCKVLESIVGPSLRVVGTAGLALGTRCGCWRSPGRPRQSGKASWWKRLVLHAAVLGPSLFSLVGLPGAEVGHQTLLHVWGCLPLLHLPAFRPPPF